MSALHTPGLPRECVLAIAEKFGAFEFGDAQGHKRLEFAAEVIAAHERIRDAAPDLLAALQLAKDSLVAFKFIPGAGNAWEDHDEANLQAVDAAIAKATGSAT